MLIETFFKTTIIDKAKRHITKNKFILITFWKLKFPMRYINIKTKINFNRSDIKKIIEGNLYLLKLINIEVGVILSSVKKNIKKKLMYV